jgi:transcriptional regulator with XRE-family HTH domain
MSFDEEGQEEQKQQEGQEIQVGEKIKRLREEKSISLKELADKTGLSSAVLSQIENHLVSPPLGTVVRIAKALDIRPGYFFDQHPDKSFTIVKKNERKPVSRFASKRGVRYGYSYESLGHDMKGRHMEPFLVTLEPTTLADPKPSAHEGEEFLFVLEGVMEVTLGENSDILQPGDAIYYDSTIPHLVKCHGGKETKILAVIYS